PSPCPRQSPPAGSAGPPPPPGGWSLPPTPATAPWPPGPDPSAWSTCRPRSYPKIWWFSPLTALVFAAAKKLSQLSKKTQKNCCFFQKAVLKYISAQACLCSFCDHSEEVFGLPN